VRPASRVPFPQSPCTERVDAPHPARRPTETYPLGTVREGNDAGADAAGLECRDLREWSPGGRCAAVQVHRTASHERSPPPRRRSRGAGNGRGPSIEGPRGNAGWLRCAYASSVLIRIP
jgi:hypothetical protein